MTFKRAFLGVALVAVVLGCGDEPRLVMEPSEVQPPPDGVVIHISHGPEDPHRVLMALQMAVMMAAERDVMVYLDIHAIDVVLADAENLSFSHFPSSQTQIAKLLELEVPIYACPGCLEAAGKEPADLAAGIRVANTDVFFDFTEGRILTLDY